MQPERARVALRDRPGWEALDLGFRMVRTWWRPVYGAWALVVLPCAALVLADHARARQAAGHRGGVVPGHDAPGSHPVPLALLVGEGLPHPAAAGR